VNRAAIALPIAALILTSACGGDNTEAPSTQDTPSAQGETTSPSPSPTAAPDPEYVVLPKPKLEAALLTIQDMPVGYSQDPPTEAGTKTFCDYKPPFNEKVYVSRDFTKGGGMSAELLRVGLRQFQSADQARAAFNALTKALSTCQTEMYNGTKMEYAPMSAPKVGDESIGVRITAEGTTLMQNFALVGPTIVATGGGGLMQANADEIARLLEAQVETYQTAAAN
jgi:hypothetical protein